jgi:hypothetical protein
LRLDEEISFSRPQVAAVDGPGRDGSDVERGSLANRDPFRLEPRRQRQHIREGLRGSGRDHPHAENDQQEGKKRAAAGSSINKHAFTPFESLFKVLRTNETIGFHPLVHPVNPKQKI